MKENNYKFTEKEPEIGAYICLRWEDGSECECVYNGLDKNILPLPTHWFYVNKYKMYKIEEIDGIKVLFLEDDLNIHEIIHSFPKDEIGLVVVGNREDFNNRLNGKKLSDFIIDPKNNKIDITKLPPIETFKIEALPEFKEPFISEDYDPQKRGWKGDVKWYDQYTKKNRKTFKKR